ncbi:MAG TPA: outer membrane beta-barrel protein [Myxococcales bacterium]|nr:outer membrane beta-barrel protein [Myxococcales bacterium]
MSSTWKALWIAVACLGSGLYADGAEPAQAPAQNASAAGTPDAGGPPPEGGSSAAAASPPEAPAPFGFADFSWAPASAGAPERPLTWGPFTGEVRVDMPYHLDMSMPIDHTISGSSEVFRSNEFQLTQIGFGGDFFYKNVQARLMTQFGMYSETTPRNDASPAVGQWNLADAYRYISEAYGGYHINVLDGINIQGGIFMSYIGLWSYYNFDNWTYQPSYVSSNTPWFFNGMRVQIFTSDKLKIEPWFVNGWQSYGVYNQQPGVGLQVLYAPTGWLRILGNQYYGADTLQTPGRMRIHTDDSIMVKWYEAKGSRFLSKGAASLTVDLGCEWGGGSGTADGTLAPSGQVTCANGTAAVPAQFFAGFMAYARLWFDQDIFGFTAGGGAITNPGRYLVLLPPINGATAISGTPYFPEGPGQPFQAWDMQTTFDYMPNGYVTFRLEYTHRAASVPYFTGHYGVTPIVDGVMGDVGAPGSVVPGWSPDLTPTEDRLTFAMMVKL